MAIEERILAVIAPVIDDLDLELVDLVYAGGRLRVTIDHAEGLDTELLTRATRLVSHELDLNDPISGKYTLEVSSPGIERPLRTPAHFQRSIGEQISLKLVPSVDGARRIRLFAMASRRGGAVWFNRRKRFAIRRNSNGQLVCVLFQSA